MVISFKTQFVQPILLGTKIHTIREDAGNRWKPGRTMQMYTGGRFTKQYKCFTEHDCVSTQRITMWLEGSKDKVILSVDGKVISDMAARNNFAVSDGFSDWIDFEHYWQPIIRKNGAGGFCVYKLLHWTNLKY